ncbi:unnamed protein product [Calypogeia fissa]
MRMAGYLDLTDSPELQPEVFDIPEDDYEEAEDYKKNTVKKARKPGIPDVVACGLICHNCRQRSVAEHVRCSKCPLRFCGRCLLNRHGEQLELELRPGNKWVCPRCRGGCGPGCYNTCCNCGPCRKHRKLDPTGPLVRTAREHGFSNVHDYLVHLETGESPAAITSRKHGRGWTATDGSTGKETDRSTGKETVRTTVMGVLAVVIGRQQHNPQALAEERPSKKRRSKRFYKVNPNWGSPTIKGYNEQELHEERLMVAGTNSIWELGRKDKIKRADYLIEVQSLTVEQIMNSWMSGADLQSESPDSEIGDHRSNWDCPEEWC